MKCNNCGKQISVNDEYCPYCNSQNINYIGKEPINENNIINNKTDDLKRDPRTIEELKEWYSDRNLPPEEVTRFFIGRDYIGAKAFGIYKDEKTGQFVVYKNKADGSRAIRYQGDNEEFAVSELLNKLKEEILFQKANNRRNRSGNGSITSNFSDGRNRRKEFGGSGKGPIIAAIIILITFLGSFFGIRNSQYGYYKYNDEYYYLQKGSWYKYYDESNNFGEYESNGWKPVEPPKELKKNRKKYYLSDTYYSSYNTSNFSYSPYYIPPETSSSRDYDDDDDDDYSYSSSSYDWDDDDDWDWSSTDWDSDW